MRIRALYKLVLLSLLVISCSKINTPEVADSIVFSALGDNQTAGVKASNPADTAFLYDNGQFWDKHSGGGYFLVEAYQAGTSVKYFTSPTTVMYHTDTDNKAWYIYNPHTRDFESRYWPQSFNLDFLAYMPVILPANANSNTVLDQNSHMFLHTFDAQTGSPTFLCDGLPLTKTGQAESREFIYAWTENQSKDVVKEEENGKVKMTFKHPFSAVYVKISEAHSGTEINDIGFKNIYNQGVFNVKQNSWDCSGYEHDKDMMISGLNDAIPTDIQLGHIYGPYLVLPQILDRADDENDVEILINHTWRGQTISKPVALPGVWESGKKYTYSVLLGDSAENILVSVMVEPWAPGRDDDENQVIEVK